MRIQALRVASWLAESLILMKLIAAVLSTLFANGIML